MAAFLGNHDGSFELFLEANYRDLLGYAVLLAGNRIDGEDLLQSSLVKVGLKWSRLSDVGAAPAYVRRTMVREQMDGWRRVSRDSLRARRTATRDVVDDPSQPIVERDAMWQALSALSSKQRAAIVLRYYDDLSEQQIADTLGCRVGTVKSTVARALNKLRGVADLATEEYR